jgi:hypothetical protein
MRQSLEDTLRELHEQLANAENLEPSEVEMLRGAVVEIQETLDQSDVSSSELAQGLRNKTLSFSETHPMLAQTIGRIADMLSQMGI